MHLHKLINKPVNIAPLVVIRMVFGLIMSASILRFILKGWVEDLYVSPKLYFPYYGFEWVHPLPEIGMHLLFISLVISFLLVAVGAFYKVAVTYSFLAFTYIELIDKTNYLNHYYFVSLFCFLLILLPANKAYSVDVYWNPKIKSTRTARGNILILQFQLAIVYFFAGLAKLNYDWLFHAMPLKIWLPAQSDLWLIGPLLSKEWMAYAFSWGGAIYDLSIPFLLFYKPTRRFAYILVIVFHLLTWFLFNIGMFPFIMIGATLIFFSAEFHQNLIDFIARFTKSNPRQSRDPILPRFSWTVSKKALIALFFLLQILIPLRYLAYSGQLFWTEQGYRFSWRVMLMEKAGYAIFHIHDPSNGRKWEVNNYDFLTPVQEKMMSTQPDMILQFAHYLDNYYQRKGLVNPIITVESYVSLNGSPSQLYIDPSLDLTKVKEGFLPKPFILPKGEQLASR